VGVLLSCGGSELTLGGRFVDSSVFPVVPRTIWHATTGTDQVLSLLSVAISYPLAY
jgi:hypothetical protein